MTDDEKLWAGFARAEMSINTTTDRAAAAATRMLELHRERWPAPAPDLDLERRLQEASDILQRLVETWPSKNAAPQKPAWSLRLSRISGDAQTWLDCGEKGEGE